MTEGPLSTHPCPTSGRHEVIDGPGRFCRVARPSARRTAIVGLGAVVLVAAGCARDAPQDTWQPAGDNARKIQNLQWPVFAIAGIVLLIVFAAVGWSVLRYRDRGQPSPSRRTAVRPSRSA